jgi:hypothetical protein
MTAATAPWDLYREIHKAMRFALAGITTRAGCADAGDEQSVRTLLEEWRDVAFVLDGHHAHEDEFCDPLIRRYASDLRDDLEQAHHRADQQLASLHVAAEGIRQATPTDRQRLLVGFHLALADFEASYLPHLHFEERTVMPMLNAAMSDAALEVVTHQIRSSVPPIDMCTYIRYMVPAMNFTERLDMLGGMYAGAPPEVFDMFRHAAQSALTPSDFEAIALAVGFA